MDPYFQNNPGTFPHCLLKIGHVIISPMSGFMFLIKPLKLSNHGLGSSKILLNIFFVKVFFFLFRVMSAMLRSCFTPIIAFPMTLNHRYQTIKAPYNESWNLHIKTMNGNLSLLPTINEFLLLNFSISASWWY